MSTFWLAIGFLTIIPTPKIPYSPDGLSRSAAWFPLVGAAIGLIIYGIASVLDYIFPLALLRSVLMVSVWVILTGGLHLDGFADCCDGMLVATSPQRRLEIMKDPRSGSFAVIGLFLLLGLKISAVTAILNQTEPMLWLPLLLAPILGRTAVIWVARQPLARKDGFGQAFAQQLKPSSLATAALLPFILVAYSLAISWIGLAAGLAVILVTIFWIRSSRRALGGVTGDVMGATIESAELVTLLAFAIYFPQ